MDDFIAITTMDTKVTKGLQVWIGESFMIYAVEWKKEVSKW